MKTIVTLLSLIFFASIGTLRAFDVPGHIVVAKIAYDYLNPHAKAKVESLSAQIHIGERRYNAVNIAGWADQIKHLKPAEDSFAGHFKYWHFIDLGRDGGPDLIGKPPQFDEQKGTVVQGLELCEQVIRDQKYTPIVPNEAVALALMIHLVGDLHQPLHCTTNYISPKPSKGRADDGGGNAVVVTNFKDRYAELHQFWDEAYKMKFDSEKNIVEAAADWDPFSITPISQELVDMEAEVLAFKPTDPIKLDGDYYKAWAVETHRVGRDVAYGAFDLKDNDYNKCSVAIDEVYEENAKKVARQQICLAGLRLAAILNKLYP